MARTLSDALIVAMIEATTRLASARASGAKSASGEGAEAAKDGATNEPHEARSAEQIGDDFTAIYKKIEEVVRASAEQETKSVGFSVR
jgi:hypothetical protein